MGINSDEFKEYNHIKKEYSIGNGEAAAIAFAHRNNGVVQVIILMMCEIL